MSSLEGRVLQLDFGEESMRAGLKRRHIIEAISKFGVVDDCKKHGPENFLVLMHDKTDARELLHRNKIICAVHGGRYKAQLSQPSEEVYNDFFESNQVYEEEVDSIGNSTGAPSRGKVLEDDAESNLCGTNEDQSSNDEDEQQNAQSALDRARKNSSSNCLEDLPSIPSASENDGDEDVEMISSRIDFRKQRAKADAFREREQQAGKNTNKVNKAKAKASSDESESVESDEGSMENQSEDEHKPQLKPRPNSIHSTRLPSETTECSNSQSCADTSQLRSNSQPKQQAARKPAVVPSARADTTTVNKKSITKKESVRLYVTNASDADLNSNRLASLLKKFICTPGEVSEDEDDELPDEATTVFERDGVICVDLLASARKIDILLRNGVRATNKTVVRMQLENPLAARKSVVESKGTWEDNSETAWDGSKVEIRGFTKELDDKGKTLLKLKLQNPKNGGAKLDDVQYLEDKRKGYYAVASFLSHKTGPKLLEITRGKLELRKENLTITSYVPSPPKPPRPQDQRNFVLSELNAAVTDDIIITHFNSLLIEENDDVNVVHRSADQRTAVIRFVYPKKYEELRNKLVTRPPPKMRDVKLHATLEADTIQIFNLKRGDEDSLEILQAFLDDPDNSEVQGEYETSWPDEVPCLLVKFDDYQDASRTLKNIWKVNHCNLVAFPFLDYLGHTVPTKAILQADADLGSTRNERVARIKFHVKLDDELNSYFSLYEAAQSSLVKLVKSKNNVTCKWKQKKTDERSAAGPGNLSLECLLQAVDYDSKSDSVTLLSDWEAKHKRLIFETIEASFKTHLLTVQEQIWTEVTCKLNGTELAGKLEKSQIQVAINYESKTIKMLGPTEPVLKFANTLNETMKAMDELKRGANSSKSSSNTGLLNKRVNQNQRSTEDQSAHSTRPKQTFAKDFKNSSTAAYSAHSRKAENSSNSKSTTDSRNAATKAKQQKKYAAAKYSAELGSSAEVSDVSKSSDDEGNDAELMNTQQRSLTSRGAPRESNRLNTRHVSQVASDQARATQHRKFPVTDSPAKLQVRLYVKNASKANLTPNKLKSLLEKFRFPADDDSEDDGDEDALPDNAEVLFEENDVICVDLFASENKVDELLNNGLNNGKQHVELQLENPLTKSKMMGKEAAKSPSQVDAKSDKKTVKISGFTRELEAKDKDTLQTKLENKKHGGGTVAKINFPLDFKGAYTAVATFESAETVQSLLAKTDGKLQLRGEDLTISPFIEPPAKPQNELMFQLSNMTSVVTDDDIANYFDKLLSGNDEDSVEVVHRSAEKQVAVIRFKLPKKLALLRRKLAKQPFPKASDAELQPIFESDTIQVFCTKYGEDEELERLNSFLYNEDKSAVRGDFCTYWSKEAPCLLVKFEDYQDASRALESVRKNKRLSFIAFPFFEYLGHVLPLKAVVDNSKLRRNVPNRAKSAEIAIPVRLDDDWKEYFSTNLEAKKSLVELAKSNHNVLCQWKQEANVGSTCTNTSNLQVVCTIQEVDRQEDLDSVLSFSDLSINNEKLLKNALAADFVKEQMWVPAEVWKEVKSKLNAVGLTHENLTSQLVQLTAQEESITLRGPRDAVRKTERTLKELVDKALEELRRKNERIDDCISLKLHEFELLELDSAFQEKLKSGCSESGRGLEVSFSETSDDKDEVKLHLSGSLADVLRAKVEVTNYSKNLMETACSADIDEGSATLLQNSKRTRIAAKKMLQSNQLEAAWHITGKTKTEEATNTCRLSVYASSAEAAKSSCKLLQEFLTIDQVTLDADQAAVLESEEWKRFVENLCQSYNSGMKTALKNGKIVIYTYKSLNGEIVSKVNDYFLENVVGKEVMSIDAIKARYMKSYMVAETNLLVQKCSIGKLQIKWSNQQADSLEVFGSVKERRAFASALSELTAKIIVNTSSISAQKTAHWLQHCKTATMQLEGIEKLYKCAILLQFEPPKNQVSSLQPKPRPSEAIKPKSVKHSSASQRAAHSIVFSNGLQVKLKLGELLQQKAVVFVNTTSKDLDLSSGQVSKLFLQHAGPKLQDECRQGLKDMGGDLKVGGFVETSACNMQQCSVIFHTALPRNDMANPQANTQVIDSITSVMRAMMNECNKKGYSSIAFPALGTGNLSYPAAIVAQAMFDCAASFGNASSQRLKTVYFVCYHKDLRTCDAFKAELQTRSNGSVQSDDNATNANSSDVPDAAGMFRSKSAKVGECLVEVLQGDILQQSDIESIVNSTDDKFSAGGLVMKSLMRVGGKKLTDEINDYGPITGDVATTSGGDTHYRFIFHAVAPRDASGWSQVVKDCLKEAESKKVKSIALPALGTGARRQQTAQAASSILDAVAQFAVSMKPTYLKHVRLCIYESAMVKDFENELENKLRDNSSSGMWKLVNSLKSMFKAALPEPKIEQQKKETPFNFSQLTDVSLLLGYENDQIPEQIIKALEGIVAVDCAEKEVLNENVTSMETQILETCRKNGVTGVITSQKVTLQGLAVDVEKAYSGILEHISATEKSKSRQTEAALLYKSTRWEYEVSPANFSPYEPEANYLIEEAYNGKQQKVQITLKDDMSDIKTVEIGFADMVETDLKISKKQRVKRSDLTAAKSGIEIAMPSTWAAMTPQDGRLKEVVLSTSEKEYKDAADYFSRSLGKIVKILEIKRIQNQEQYSKYMVNKQIIETRLKRSNSTLQVEYLLFHGTSEDSVESINKNGFNRSYCGKNATAYGNGVYFAVNSSYSARNTYSSPNQRGEKFVYLAQVLVGESTLGHSGLLVPPENKQTNELYDSVSDSGLRPIWVEGKKYADHCISLHCSQKLQCNQCSYNHLTAHMANPKVEIYCFDDGQLPGTKM